ncbi:MAG: GntR family transcriptional regulator [Bifidobacterium sp.]
MGKSCLLVQRISAYIIDEQFRPDERLGTERELAERFGVTRSELRCALETMETQHQVKRIIGRKGGVVVADNRLERNLNSIDSMREIARKQSFNLTTQVINKRMRNAEPYERRTFGMQQGQDDRVYCITRLRRIDTQPVCAETSVVPVALFPNIIHMNLDSMAALFSDVFHMPPHSSQESLETVTANSAIASLLALHANDMIMRVTRLSLNTHSRVFEIGSECYRPERVRFHLNKLGYVRHSGVGAYSA